MVTFGSVVQARRHATRRSFRVSWVWLAQIGLAALFVFAGLGKLMMPADDLVDQSGLSISFMRFISAAEVLGGLGLVLPGLTRSQRWLTPLAAVGLVAIMVGAVVVTVAQTGVLPAPLPLAVGVLAASVAVRRRGWIAGA